MLVLTRREDEQVILGDEVTVTVEKICRLDGRRIFGARARLGFQLPRQINIRRAEWRPRDFGGGSGGPRRPAPPLREGTLVEIADATLQLSVRLPRKIPVSLNGLPVAADEESASNGTRALGPELVYHLDCQKEDRIAICRSFVVTVVGCELFVMRRAPSWAVG
jgi:sRNA-binding carbon storage regulator CsrA